MAPVGSPSVSSGWVSGEHQVTTWSRGTVQPMTAPAGLDRFWAVVPAGGAGTRLWPVSRASSPKFLHDLTGGGRTLIQDTVDRLRDLAGERVLVVTGGAHAQAVREQVPDLPEDLLLTEPSPRDSMAAIGLAAAVL